MAIDGFDYKQYVEYVNSLEIATQDFDTFLKKFLLEQAQRVVAKAKRRTPVDTGALRASWGIGSQKLVFISNMNYEGNVDVSLDTKNSTIADISVIGDNLEVTIWNGMEYASYVELGHSTPAGNWVRGYFMLTISISEVEKAMSGRFDKEFKQFLKSKGVI